MDPHAEYSALRDRLMNAELDLAAAKAELECWKKLANERGDLIREWVNRSDSAE